MEGKSNVLKTVGSILSIVGGVLFLVGLVFLGIQKWGWIVAISVGSPGFLLLLAGNICLSIYFLKKRKKKILLATGKYVMAELVDIEWVHTIRYSTNYICWSPYRITCRYLDPTGKAYYFKSEGLLYNPECFLQGNLLKVYVDLEKSTRYYVDVNSILPNNVVLHKFVKLAGSERLKDSGKYVLATTCGTELVQTPRKNAYTCIHYVMEPKPTMKLATACQDALLIRRIGYRVLCRYDAPNGEIHIFASKGRWGAPEQSYKDGQVRVYYEGKDFKNYYVDF